MVKRLKRCSHCESEEVKLDAWAAWDVETQQWVLDNVFDAAWCNECEGECTIVDNEVEDVETTQDTA